MPGLYVFALASLLGATLRRWYDPVPARAWALFALVVGGLFGPVLVLGGVLLPLDMIRSVPPFQDEAPGPRAFVLQIDLIEDFTPYFAHARRTLKRFEWPLMNELVGAGEPFLANTQSQTFQPLVVLTYPLPLPRALGAIAALKVLLALVFTFLFLRRLGLGEGSSLLGSVSYACGGFSMMYLGWPHTHASSLLPCLLYAVERTRAVGGRRDLLLGAVASAAVLLGGHPETSLYAAIAATVLGLVRLLAHPGCSRREALRRTLGLGLATGLGALATAPVLLPAALAMPHSERSMLLDMTPTVSPLDEIRRSLADAEAIAGTTRRLVRRAVPVLAPFALGTERLGHYWGATKSPQDLAPFAGTLALLLVLTAGRGSPRFPGERTLAWLGGLALFVFVQPPGLVALLNQVPGLSSSASHHRRAAFLTCFALAATAATAAERLRRRPPDARRVLFALAVVSSTLVALHLAFPPPVTSGGIVDFRRVWLGGQLAIAGLGAVLLLRAGSRRRWELALPALAALELLLAFAPYHRPAPERLFYPSDPAITWIREHLDQDDRIVGLGRVFRHNFPLVYGLPDLRSGNPMQPGAIPVLTRPLRARRWERTFSVADHPLYDLLGVRYVLGKVDNPLPEPLRLVERGDLWVWERPRPLSRIFLPRSSRAVTAASWPEATAEISDFLATSVVEATAERPGAWRADPSRPSRLVRLDLEPTHGEVTVELGEPRLLASGIYQDGGWRLLVDGTPHPTVRANGPFVGAWLPAGRRRLDLVYRPPGFLPGCLLAALAIAGLAAWLVPLERQETGA